MGEVAQRMCADQVVQLRNLRSKVLDEQSSAFVRTSAGAGRCAALVEELLRVQGEVESIGNRCSTMQGRLSEAEQQGREWEKRAIAAARHTWAAQAERLRRGEEKKKSPYILWQ